MDDLRSFREKMKNEGLRVERTDGVRFSTNKIT